MLEHARVLAAYEVGVSAEAFAGTGDGALGLSRTVVDTGRSTAC